MTLDGELYNHAYKNSFERIVSFVRQETPKEGHEVVQYHCYDLISDSKTGSSMLTPFAERAWVLAGIVAICGASTTRRHLSGIPVPLVFVDTREVADVEELMHQFTEDRKQGYEGSMVRNAKSAYEGKRSYNLQKIKSFDDAEFEIIGVKAGRGRMAECAIFQCRTKKGAEFDCKMEGSLETLKPFLLKPKSVIGKMLTVRYQGFTNRENVPRFPVGIALRDYE